MSALQSVKEGSRVKIVKIEAAKGSSSQLKHMGLLIGDVIKVVRNSAGHVIVAKGNLRLALGKTISSKIFVEQCQKERQ